MENLGTLRHSQAWADAIGPSRAAVTVEPNTQPRADGGASAGPGPSPGPGNAGPSESSSTTTSSITPSSISGNESSSSSSAPAPSVADLLSQLRASQDLEHPPSTTANAVRESDRTLERRSPPGPPPPLNHTLNASPVPEPQSVSTHASKSQQDVRSLSFQQALPHIAQLTEDPRVVESLTKVTGYLHLIMFSFHYCVSP